MDIVALSVPRKVLATFTIKVDLAKLPRRKPYLCLTDRRQSDGKEVNKVTPTVSK